MSNPPISPWDTPGITQRLRELHALKGADELSMTEIAERLNREFKTNLSRNSIIGRCHRNTMLARRPSVFNVHHAKRKAEKMIPINRRVRVDAPIVPEMFCRRRYIIRHHHPAIALHHLPLAARRRRG